MITVNLTFCAVVASAIVLSGCASTPVSSKDEVHLGCRTAKPLTCDHIPSRDAHDIGGRSFISHPWLKDKPWLSEIVLPNY